MSEEAQTTPNKSKSPREEKKKKIVTEEKDESGGNNKQQEINSTKQDKDKDNKEDENGGDSVLNASNKSLSKSADEMHIKEKKKSKRKLKVDANTSNNTSNNTPPLSNSKESNNSSNTENESDKDDGNNSNTTSSEQKSPRGSGKDKVKSSDKSSKDGSSETSPKNKKSFLQNSSNKLLKFFGKDRDIEDGAQHKNFAPQPAHVKHYKMKRKFGEDVVLGNEPNDEEDNYQNPKINIVTAPDDSDEAEESRTRAKNRRVKKFFGQDFDVHSVSYSQQIRAPEPPKVSRAGSKKVQPRHVDVSKLNKFFGRNTEVHRRTDSEEKKVQLRKAKRKSVSDVEQIISHRSTPELPDLNDDDDEEISPKKREVQSDPEVASEESSESDFSLPIDDGAISDQGEAERLAIRKKFTTTKKLRRYFGEALDERDREAKQFEKQPLHVKQYKLNKHFGGGVVVEKVGGGDANEVPIHSELTSADIIKTRKLHTFFGDKTVTASGALTSRDQPPPQQKPGKLSPRSKSQSAIVEPSSSKKSTTKNNNNNKKIDEDEDNLQHRSQSDKNDKKNNKKKVKQSQSDSEADDEKDTGDEAEDDKNDQQSSSNIEYSQQKEVAGDYLSGSEDDNKGGGESSDSDGKDEKKSKNNKGDDDDDGDSSEEELVKKKKDKKKDKN